jgi:propanol-preferring alcohol dehydrogenase
VIAVDIAADKLELAKSLGADDVINAATEDVLKTLRTMGGAHAAIVTSSAKAAYTQARSAGGIADGGGITVRRNFFSSHPDARNQNQIGRYRYSR